MDNDNKEILDIVNYDEFDLLLDFFEIFINPYFKLNINIQGGGLKIMSDMIKELMPYLEKVAEKLSSTATTLWQLQIQQGKVVLITGVVQYTVLTILSVLMFLLCRRLYKNWTRMEGLVDDRKMTHNAMENETFGYITGPLLVIGFMLVYYVFKVPSITDLFTIMYNPEYWALREIIKMVK